MNQGAKLVFELPDATLADANKEVTDLERCIERAAADRGVLGSLSFDAVRVSADAQDTGTLIGIIISGPAAAAIAAGIQMFIAKSGSRVKIYDDNKNVLIEASGGAADNIDVAKTIEAYRRTVLP